MTTVTSSRLGRILGYDGAVATMLLAVFQYFLVSASFVACLAPTLIFQALVGWQGTHLALWLGAASLLPVGPGLTGLAVASSRLLDSGAGAGAGQAFWSTFADVARCRGGMVLTVSAGALVLGYDVALLGADGAVLLGAVAAGAMGAALLLGASFLIAAGTSHRGLALALAAARLTLLRPHLALVWVLLGALAVGVTLLPVIGALGWFAAPAVAAVAAHICNRTLGFATAAEKVNA